MRTFSNGHVRVGLCFPTQDIAIVVSRLCFRIWSPKFLGQEIDLNSSHQSKQRPLLEYIEKNMKIYVIYQFQTWTFDQPPRLQKAVCKAAISILPPTTRDAAGDTSRRLFAPCCPSLSEPISLIWAKQLQPSTGKHCIMWVT